MEIETYNIINNTHHLPVAVEIKTMQEIDQSLGGIADKPHRHNYYTIIWATQATGKHIVDFKEYSIESNDIFFVSPQQVHQVNTNPAPEGFVFLFTQDFLANNSIQRDLISNLKLFQNVNENPPLKIDMPKAEKLQLFANEMLKAYKLQKPMFLETIGAFLKLFLIECNQICSLNQNPNIQTVEVSKSLLLNFKSLVETNFTKWHQVQKYANQLSINSNYLNEVIKSNTGHSAKDFIQERIILEAKRLLVFSPKTAKEIAYQLGFEDPSHFSKFFKTQTNSSIQEFKSRIEL